MKGARKVKQPDFSAVFREWCTGIARPIRYELRPYDALLHDLAFLNSLIHDARILNPGVLVEKKKVIVKLNRDCWELGDTKTDTGLELHIADSILEITGIRSCNWILPKRRSSQPWIDYLWIDRDYRDHDKSLFRLHMVGTNRWECTFTLSKDQWSIQMNDLETPYLWSRRYGGSKRSSNSGMKRHVGIKK